MNIQASLIFWSMLIISNVYFANDKNVSGTVWGMTAIGFLIAALMGWIK